MWRLFPVDSVNAYPFCLAVVVLNQSLLAVLAGVCLKDGYRLEVVGGLCGGVGGDHGESMVEGEGGLRPRRGVLGTH